MSTDRAKNASKPSNWAAGLAENVGKPRIQAKLPPDQAEDAGKPPQPSQTRRPTELRMQRNRRSGTIQANRPSGERKKPPDNWAADLADNVKKS